MRCTTFVLVAMGMFGCSLWYDGNADSKRMDELTHRLRNSRILLDMRFIPSLWTIKRLGYDDLQEARRRIVYKIKETQHRLICGSDIVPDSDDPYQTLLNAYTECLNNIDGEILYREKAVEEEERMKPPTTN